MTSAIPEDAHRMPHGSRLSNFSEDFALCGLTRRWHLLPQSPALGILQLTQLQFLVLLIPLCNVSAGSEAGNVRLLSV